ncbi:Hypothetical protein PHPALM_987 [Phytophthora palmivora]|uniref:Uncharacterized protein n=1 Tax=Phytophthora palmivora TaxID=4796 RepID=A0A2P4YTH6_9STRA|nr:Hypothetical protein PHPALM_987 [Phytophthora palmivora]
MATNNPFSTRQVCGYFYKVVLDAQDEPTPYHRCLPGRVYAIANIEKEHIPNFWFHKGRTDPRNPIHTVPTTMLQLKLSLHLGFIRKPNLTWLVVLGPEWLSWLVQRSHK